MRSNTQNNKQNNKQNNNKHRRISSIPAPSDAAAAAAAAAPPNSPRPPSPPRGRTRRRLSAAAAGAGLLSACLSALLPAPALAQQAVQAAPQEEAAVPAMQRVEVTGSLIRRSIASQTSLPITSVRAEDFVKQGLSTAQEVLNTIPMNQTSVSSSQSVGLGTGGQAQADLRGLGGNKTLVLLNGKRDIYHTFHC